MTCFSWWSGLASLLDENRLAVVAKQHGIKKAKDSDSIGKLFVAYARRAEENVLGRVLVERPSSTQPRGRTPRRFSAMPPTVYKVDTDAIALKVKQEFCRQRENAVREEACN